MNRRSTLRRLAAAGVAIGLPGAAVRPALAQAEPIRIGLILSMTGPFASTGRQIEAGVKLWMAQNGNTVAGRRIEVILKDDAGTADVTRRLAQELVVNDKVTAIAGFCLTPLGLAAAPIATQSKTPMVVMVAATASVIDASPFMVRVSMTVPQLTLGVAQWAPRNGIRKAMTLVSDYGPGIDAEKYFVEQFTKSGGQIVESLRVPLRSPDFAPFLQKVRDARPEGLFVFVPAGVGAAMMKQFAERGLDKAGIRLIGTGDITEDDILPGMGDVALGVVTSHHYSAAHDSAVNKAFVEAFRKANNGLRPNFMAVAGYDGMRAIYQALEATKGAGGEAMVNAMRGMTFESPRGPIQIDPQTRDIVHNIYVRKVERVGGELYNVEFDTLKMVGDPRGK